MFFNNKYIGGILTVADDFLKNDGQRFLALMEELASRRLRPIENEEDLKVLNEEEEEEEEDDEDWDEVYDEEYEEDDDDVKNKNSKKHFAKKKFNNFV